MEDDKETKQHKLTVLDFTKKREEIKKLEEEKNKQVDEDELFQYYFELYAKVYAAFQYIESDANYVIATTKLREAFNNALSITNLDAIEDNIHEILGTQDE